MPDELKETYTNILYLGNRVSKEEYRKKYLIDENKYVIIPERDHLVRYNKKQWDEYHNYIPAGGA